MYTLNCIASHSLAHGAYIYDVQSLPSGLVAIASDDCLHVLDPARLHATYSIRKIHDGVTGLAALNAEGNLLCTTGRDGWVAVHDLHSGKTVAQVKDDTSAPVLAAATNLASNVLATGSELTNHQATVSLWDIRALDKPVTQYIDSHSDDVTEFHPDHHSRLLLSGSTDGLINVYNTAILTEEDALHQTINHGHSIHHAMFPHDADILALSHDEHLSAYRLLEDPGAEVSEDQQLLRHYGDVRTAMGCEYVVDIKRRPDGGAVMGIGNHSRSTFELLHMSRSAEAWVLESQERISLLGGHGEEVVRCFDFDDRLQLVLSGGEDGNVKAWKARS